MATSITVRNIPKELLESARALAERDRRSLNQALIILMEQGLQASLARQSSTPEQSISRESQIAIWQMVCGGWNEKSRSTKEIIEDIYASRTIGREIKL